MSFLIECIDPNGERAKAIRMFHAFACERLGIVGGPKVDFEPHLGTTSFGLYSPSDDSIRIAVEGRHISDILRTMAHEMVHHVQLVVDQNEDVTIEDLEYEANACAGMIMRDYNKLHPEMFGLSADVEAPPGTIGDSQGAVFPDVTRPSGPIEFAEEMTAGAGDVAGLGVGPQGEPGITKKKSPIMAPMVRRKTFKQLREELTPAQARKEFATVKKPRTAAEEAARKALLKK